MKQLVLDMALPERCALDDFVVGGNAELVSCLRELLAPDAPERFVYLWGIGGCGKSHLLRALVDEALGRGLAAVYLDQPHHGELRADLDRLDLVAVDDADRLRDGAQVALFDLYNRMRERGGCLVVAGELPPAMLRMRPELATRLGWGLVFQVRALTDHDKMQALVNRAQMRGLALQPEVAAYLLRHADRDLASLLRLLDDLDRYSLETRRAITVQLVRELMRPDGG